MQTSLLVPQHSIANLSTNRRQLQTGSHIGSENVIELPLFTCWPKPLYCASDEALELYETRQRRIS